MKRLILFICLTIPFQILAQSSGEAHYEVRLAEDHFYFNGVLKFNQKESFFTYKQQNKDKWVREEGEFGPMQIIYTDTIGYQIWKAHHSPETIVREYCGYKTSHVFEDSVSLNWNIDFDEEKTLSGILCKKATTTFRGRQYEAWYAPSIPVSAGPLKFRGLPGLIFNIYESKEEVHIFLTRINFSSLVDVKKSGLEVNSSIEEFNVCLDQEWTNFYNKTQSNIAKIQAKYPELEISDNNLSVTRPSTEKIEK